MDKCSVPPHYQPQSYPGPYMYPFQQAQSYYGSDLYGGRYLVPFMYQQPTVPVAQDSPPCSWIIKDDKDMTRENALAGKQAHKKFDNRIKL